MKENKIFALYVSVFAAMLGLGIISPLLPALTQKFDANGFWIGMIFSGFAISRAVVMPIIGKLSDTKGKKTFIVLGLMMLTIASLLYILAANVYILTAIRLFHGVAAGMVIPVAMAYAAERVKEGKEAHAMALLAMVFYLGFGSGPLLSGIVSQVLNADAVFFLIAALSFLSLLIAAFFLHETNSRVAQINQEAIAFKDLIKRTSVRVVLIVTVANAFRTSVLVAFSPLLAHRMHIGASGIGIMISTGIFLGGFLLPAFGRLADKLGRTGKLSQILIGSFVGTAALLILPICPNFTSLLIASAVLGISAAASIAPATGISVIIGQRVGMGLWMGIYNTALCLGIIIAPLASGIAMDIFGIDSAFYLTGSLSLVCTMVACYYFLKWRLQSGDLSP